MEIIDINKLPKEDGEKLNIPKFTNVDSTIKELSDRILSVGEITDVEIQTIIFNSYSLFLNDLYLRGFEHREDLIKLFRNKRFVEQFVYCMAHVQLYGYQMICCNKITYDALCTENLSSEIKEQLLQLSYTVNRGLINVLSTKISLKYAKYIALMRHSSFDEQKNIVRVCNIILDMEVDEQDIINIFSILFKDCLTALFEAIMFNVCTDLNDKQASNYYLINKAIIDILENMPTYTIRQVLYSYTINQLNKRCKIRFSLNNDSMRTSYPRISNVIDILNMEEEIKVP